MWGLLPLGVRLTYKGLRAPSVVVDCFYTVIFSALSSRLNALPCDSAWVTSFYSEFLSIPRSGLRA